MFARETADSPTQLYLHDLNGHVTRRVTTTPGDTSDASFSPDGSPIVFAGCPEGGCPSADLYLMPTDGTWAPARISDPNEVQDNDPYFSPDGKSVTWNRNRLTQILPPAGESLALIAPFDGDTLGVPTQIGDNQLNSVPTWSQDGDSLYAHRFDFDGTKRWDVVRLSVSTGEMSNLTDRHRTGEMADWTFLFPHAGTPSTLVSADAALPQPFPSGPEENPTTTPRPTPTPESQSARFGGILLPAGIAGAWWWRRSGSSPPSVDPT